MTLFKTVKEPVSKLLEESDGGLSFGIDSPSLLSNQSPKYGAEKNEEDDDGSLFPRRIRKSEIIHLTNQLAIMVDTGISLANALEGIGEQEENPSLKELIESLRVQVESGEDFSKALAGHPKHFNPTYIAMVKSSEQTGGLAAMLDTIATYLRKEVETRSKVKSAMAYPAVMAALAVVVTIFLLTFVLPKFEPLFAKKGTSLPRSTKVMMSVSSTLLNYWWAWLLGVAGLIVGFLFGRRTEPGKMGIDWVKLHLPILGAVFRKVSISRSLRTLGTMLESGVSVLEALQLSAEVSGNYYYRQLWLRVHDEVTTGNRICQALAGDPLFPPTMVQMIGSGEETARLNEVLNKVSDHYEFEVDSALKVATSVLEPLMITVMGVVVGGIAMGLLLPIFSLSRGG